MTSDSSRTLKTVKVICTVLLLTYVFYNAGIFTENGRKEFLNVLKSGNIFYLVVTFSFTFLLDFHNSLKWRFLVRAHGFLATQGHLFSYYLVGRFFNIFLPSSIGGDLVRIRLLGRHSGRYAASAATVFMERVTGLTTLLLISIIAIYIEADIFNMIWLKYVIVAGAGCILFLCWVVISEKPLSALRKLNFFMDRKFEAVFVKIDKFRSASSFYQKKPGVLALAFVNSLIFYFLAIANSWIAVKVFYPQVLFVDMIFAVPIIMLIMNIPVSIGYIGITEFAYTFVLSLFGISPAVALTTALLMHLKALFAASIGGATFAMLEEKEALKEDLATMPNSVER